MHIFIEVHDALNVLLVLVVASSHELLNELSVVLVDRLRSHLASRYLALCRAHLGVRWVVLEAVVLQRVAKLSRQTGTNVLAVLKRLAQYFLEAFLHLQAGYFGAIVS